jgi:hypothetical protein
VGQVVELANIDRQTCYISGEDVSEDVLPRKIARATERGATNPPYDLLGPLEHVALPQGHEEGR